MIRRLLLVAALSAVTLGRTTKDETTPLVFVDGELVGWGESAIEYATAQ